MAKDKNEKIRELLERGVEKIYPSKGWLEKKLKAKEKLSIYLGIDPTGDTLHIGHAIALMKMKQFQDLGHKVILLIGSFTGMIGDPTGKSTARKPLTREQVLKNAKKFKEQAGIFLNFGGKNPAVIKYNHEWLDKLTLKDLAEIGMQITAQQLWVRDMFQERVKKGEAVYFTELMYPLLQGYDSVAMEVDGEIGGNDQTFNMLVGRDLLKKMKSKEKFILTIKLLTDPMGKKMGKSEDNMITLAENSKNMFGKIMSWPDEFILPGLELLTFKSKDEIEKIKRETKKGGRREAKLDLAEEAVKIYHGEKEAKKVREDWVNVFSNKKVIKDFIKDIESDKIQDLVWVIKESGYSDSKSAIWRLIKQGGISVDGKKKLDPKTQLTGGELIKIGRQGLFVKFLIKNRFNVKR